MSAGNDAGDQEAGNNEKNINPDKSARDQPGLSVISDHQQNGDSSQSIDVRAISTCLVLVSRPSNWQCCIPLACMLRCCHYHQNPASKNWYAAFGRTANNPQTRSQPTNSY